MLPYADVCGRMRTYADVCYGLVEEERFVCCRMLTYADVCGRMLTYATG
jgi:hypothetical protein